MDHVARLTDRPDIRAYPQPLRPVPRSRVRRHQIEGGGDGIDAFDVAPEFPRQTVPLVIRSRCQVIIQMGADTSAELRPYLVIDRIRLAVEADQPVFARGPRTSFANRVAKNG